MNIVLGVIEKALLLLVWDRQKESKYDNGSACNVSQTNPTRECEGQ